MGELSNRKIRFSDAAHAIGVKPKALRNWLQRNKIILFTKYDGREWAEFSFADIAVLALMRRLVKWGLKVDYANEIAFSEIQAKAGPLLSFENAPLETLPALLSGWQLFLFDEDENGDPIAAMIPAQDVLPQRSDFLFVNPGQVVSEAFSRLASPANTTDRDQA